MSHTVELYFCVIVNLKFASLILNVLLFKHFRNQPFLGTLLPQTTMLAYVAQE